jgi:microcystin degradation protein MlrC
MSARRRLALIGMWQETNTYSPRPTGLAEFEAFELTAGAGVVAHHEGTGSVIGGFLDGLGDGGAEAVGVFSAGAWPSGPPDAATAEELLARLDAALAAAPAVDGALVNLHGAMVAAGHDDLERETLARVRAHVGPDAPVAAVLDLHGNPSAEAVACCDVVVGYRTYPHVDMRACGREAAELALRMLAGERLVTVLGKLPLLTSPVAQATDDEPMRGLLTRAEERAAAAGVARVSLLPGFPYSDVPRAGFSVTATAPAARERQARELVAATLDDVAAHAEQFVTAYDGPAAAVERALALEERPVVLADLADNVGGGGPGDGTALLAELVARRVAGAVVPLVDRAAVAAARAAGVGAELALELGARSDALHGSPVAVRAHVVALGDGAYVARGSYMTGQRFSMGATAVLDVGGVRVLAMERATPPFHVEQLTANGIDPAEASLIALKGAVAWRAPYAEVVRAAIEVDTPGCCPADPLRLPRVTTPLALDPRT